MNLSLERLGKETARIIEIKDSIVPQEFYGSDLYTCLAAAKTLCQSIVDNAANIPEIAFNDSKNAFSDLYTAWLQGRSGNPHDGNLAINLNRHITAVQQFIGWYLRPPESNILKTELSKLVQNLENIEIDGNKKLNILTNKINRITKREAAVNFIEITNRSFSGAIIIAILMVFIIGFLTWFAYCNYINSQQQYDSFLSIVEHGAMIRSNNPFVQVNQIFPAIPDWVVWKLISARILLITLGSVVLVMLFKLFRSFQHNHTVNSHRASALSIGEELIKALKGTQAEGIAAAQAYEAIFAHQDSGFADGKQDSNEHLAAIIKAAIEKNK